MSNVLFRSLLNQCRTVYSYEKVRRSDGSMGFSAAELESGAISICQALDGKYKDLNGRLKKVNGDFTKVRYAVHLNEAGSACCRILSILLDRLTAPTKFKS